MLLRFWAVILLFLGISLADGPMFAQGGHHMSPQWWECLFPFKGRAVASWYGPGFHGKPMASGKLFDMFNPRTVAHKTLPFGTRVRMVNPANGRSVVVFVADRGPYVKGRDFDLSFAAAKRLGITRAGVAVVYFAVLGR